jgi:hypothetical protein
METVFAQGVDLKSLAPSQSVSSFGILVNAIVRNAFVFAGIVSFLFLIFGGFQVIVSAGDPKKTEQGRNAIKGAVIGLLLVVGSFWIVQIIEVVTGAKILNPGI